MPWPRRRYQRTKPLSTEHRARLLENLQKAWRAPRGKRGPASPAQRAAARANLVRARKVLRQRGWPHSAKQRAAGRVNIRKAQAAIRERGLPNTPARRAAAAANLAKANARLRELKYPRNEKQKAAARANFAKARAASRQPKNYRRYHRHKLKHGLQVRSLEQTLRLLDEDPREFEAHCQRFRRVFAPAGPGEERVVRRIAAAVWRHLRLFRAQARWQADALGQYFEHADPIQPLDAEATRDRAFFLMILLTDRDKFFLHDQRLTSGVERALRLLLRLRSGDDRQLRLYARRTERDRREFEEIEEERRSIEQDERMLEFRERLAAGDPAAWRTLGQVRKELNESRRRRGWPSL